MQGGKKENQQREKEKDSCVLNHFLMSQLRVTGSSDLKEQPVSTQLAFCLGQRQIGSFIISL